MGKANEQILDEKFFLGSMKDKPPSDPVDSAKFCEALFGPDWADQMFVAMARDPADPSNLMFPHEADPAIATHYCQSWFEVEDGKPNRRRDNWGGLCCIVLDDVGEKAGTPSVMPTAIMRTKPGSEQWIYAFREPIEDEALAQQILASLEAAEAGDTNTLRLNQVFRLPGSLPPAKEHRAELTHWDPVRLFDGDLTILDILKVEPIEASTLSSFSKRKAPYGTRVHDEVVDWLEESGHVRGEEGDWLVVTCPCRQP